MVDTTEAELSRLRLTVAKVREVYRTLREWDRPIGDADIVNDTCRTIANAIEDALIEADYEAAAGPEEGER